MSSTPPPPKGWYPDPHHPEQLRYWDGASWTQHTYPLMSPPPLDTAALTKKIQTTGMIGKICMIGLSVLALFLQVYLVVSFGPNVHLFLSLLKTPNTPHVLPQLNPYPAWTSLVNILSLSMEVFLFIWLYRSMDEARLLGYPTSFAPYWGVLCWFIPFVNFVMPYLCIRDCFRPQPHRGAPWKGLFWTAYLLQGVATITTLTLIFVNNTAPYSVLPIALVLGTAMGIILAVSGLSLSVAIENDHLEAVTKIPSALTMDARVSLTP